MGIMASDLGVRVGRVYPRMAVCALLCILVLVTQSNPKWFYWSQAEYTDYSAFISKGHFSTK